jgi:type II secretory pathway pseudopilin PulG
MKKGFGLLEIVVAVGIISISIYAVFGLFTFAIKSVDENLEKAKAVFLLEEGVEAVRVLRDSSWQNNIASLTAGEDYYLEFTGATWQATSSNVYIQNAFERKFVLEDVYRDGNDDIAETGTLDPDTRKLTVSVSFLGSKGTTTRSVITYLTNLFSN